MGVTELGLGVGCAEGRSGGLLSWGHGVGCTEGRNGRSLSWGWGWGVQRADVGGVTELGSGD